MHIASGFALVRREPAQSDVASGLTSPERLNATRTWLRKILPGAILLTVLAALGALFPIVF